MGGTVEDRGEQSQRWFKGTLEEAPEAQIEGDPARELLEDRHGRVSDNKGTHRTRRPIDREPKMVATDC